MKFARTFSRLSRRTAAIALCTIGLVTVGIVTATPASAATNVCQDSTIASPTEVHATPSGYSAVVEYMAYDTGVNNGGFDNTVCEYFNNTSEGKWFMPVRTYNGANGGIGYIWVQRLNLGRYHRCWNLFAGEQSIPSAYCFLSPTF